MVMLWTGVIGRKYNQEFDLIPAITRKEVELGAKQWERYAPPWWLVNWARGTLPFSELKKVLTPGIPLPPPRSQSLQYRDWAKATYISMLPETHDELLQYNKILLSCFCRNPSACHRGFLAEHLMKYGAVYEGELE